MSAHAPQPTSAGRASASQLAQAYQPRRVIAAFSSIALNLFVAILFVSSGLDHAVARWLTPAGQHDLPLWLAPAYLAAFFGFYVLLNLLPDLWFGYLQERQFGLAKEGVRAWLKVWLIGVSQQGAMFVAGSCLILMAQALWPDAWLACTVLLVLGLFLGTTWLAADLIPAGLFQFEPAEPAFVDRLRALAGDAEPLPPVIVYTAPSLRDFAGGLVGLGRRQVLLISRAAADLASDTLLRFVAVRESGRRRYHHLLLCTLTGWAMVSLGLCAAALAIGHFSAAPTASPLYIPWLALFLTLWMTLSQPLTAYVGRRLEYQADRHYLRHGTLEEMRQALEELSSRNLARTDPMTARQTALHPLPSVANRLHKAQVYLRRVGRDPSLAGGPA